MKDPYIMNLTIFILYYASLEYWAFEVLVFLAGLMPDSQITISLIAIWYASYYIFFFCY